MTSSAGQAARGGRAGRVTRSAIYGALLLAFVLRHDLWWWDDPRPLLGLPIGLTYHVAFCFLVAGLMALLVRFAWPSVDS
jgi:hypothetical protein